LIRMYNLVHLINKNVDNKEQAVINWLLLRHNDIPYTVKKVSDVTSQTLAANNLIITAQGKFA